MKQERMGSSASPGAFSFLVSLMDSVPLPLFVADFSPLLALAENAGGAGFSYREFFITDPGERDRVAAGVRIIHSNEEGGRFLGERSLPGKGEAPWLRFDAEAWSGLGQALDSFLAGGHRAEFPINLNTPEGQARLRTLRLELPDYAKSSWSHVVVCIVEPGELPLPWSTEASSIDSGQLFENMTVGFALHEMLLDEAGRPVDYRFLKVNRAFERITGLSRAKILGRRVREVMPGIEAGWIEAYGSVVLSGQPLLLNDYASELGRWFEVWAYRPSAGRFATMVQDITANHERETLIRRQGERLDLALDATEAGIWELDLTTAALEVDERWEALLGYAPGSFPRTLVAWEALCSPADLGATRSHRLGHLAGETRRYSCELRLRHRDGRELWFLDRGRVSSRDSEGKALRMVGTLVNVDRRKRAELAEVEQRSRLTSLLASLDDLVYFKDREGRYQGANRAFSDFFGLGMDEIVGKSAEAFFPPDLAASITTQIALVLSREESLLSEEWYVSKEGRRVLLEKKLSPLRDPEGRVIGVAGISRDVTARHDAETQSRLRISLLEYARDHGWKALAGRAIDEVLGLCASRLGFIYGLEGSSSSGILLAGTGRLPQTLALQGREACLECLHTGPLLLNDLGSSTWTAIHGLGRGIFVPVLRGGRPVGILGLARDGEAYDGRDLGLCASLAEQVWDIIQVKVAEDRIAESDRSKEETLEVTNAGLWTWYVEEGRRECDGHWARLVGLDLGEVEALGKDATDSLIHPEDYASSLAARERHLRGESPLYESELRLHHRDGRWIWVLDRGEVVERDREGHGLKMSGITVDITRIKATEARLLETVADKEALLRELYHRTNNSMQLVNAMLELKKIELPPGEVTRAFDEIQAKIIAMALVQEKIYRSGNLSTIDLGDYLADLVDRLRDEESGREDCPDFSVDVVPVPVAVDAAIPCGIIVSELIGNAVHHAFSPGRKGEIGVVLGIDKEALISIEVWDNGGGFPQGFDPRTSSHLGLRTVLGIGEEQLHGKVGFGERAPGLSVSLSFRNDYLPKRL